MFQILAISKKIYWILLIFTIPKKFLRTLTKRNIMTSELKDMFCCLNDTSYVWSSLIIVSETLITYTRNEEPLQISRHQCKNQDKLLTFYFKSTHCFFQKTAPNIL